MGRRGGCSWRVHRLCRHFSTQALRLTGDQTNAPAATLRDRRRVTAPVTRRTALDIGSKHDDRTLLSLVCRASHGRALDSGRDWLLGFAWNAATCRLPDPTHVALARPR